ncbi:MAG: hypothetical protein IKC65_05680 [Lentisphaeria bacterium]|nr:hypothetical protein [Lentisphaeria bacterium]
MTAKKKIIPDMVARIAFVLGGVVLVIALAYGAYLWFFCRVYVPAGMMAVVTAKTGKQPRPGTILVEKGEKGIWKEVLSEGRYFFDPVLYDVKLSKNIDIPLGKVGIVTSKVGKELPAGEIIAADAASKGVQREVLGPGVYRLNPEGYKVEIVDAINIPPGYVGIVTGQTGKAPRPGHFAVRGEKGVMQDILQPGLYYINHYAFQINVIEIGMNQVTMSGNAKGASVVSGRSQLASANSTLQSMASNTLKFQTELRRQVVRPRAVKAPVRARNVRGRAAAAADRAVPLMAAKAYDTPSQIFGLSRAVEFPSRDGFKVLLDMTVEFELLPEKISLIYMLYGDLPQVVEKILLPQVLSVSRLKGSSYRAQDFIMGDGREKFQLDLRNELVKTLESKHIVVHNAIIRNVEIPRDILTPIQAVSLAQEQNLTNMAMQNTAKKLAELNTETELIEQRRQEVSQETEKIVASINAERKRDVAAIEAAARLKVAEIQLKKSEIIAKTNQLKGETDAKAKFLTENEKAKGELLKARAVGDGALLSQMVMVNALNPKVKTRIIHAGPGTLWTDLKGAAVAIPAK